MEQDPLIVAVDPAHVDFQHAGRLDQFQPRQKPLHATDRRVRRAGLDAVQGRVRLVVVDGNQRIKPVAHRCRQTLRHAVRQQGAGLGVWQPPPRGAARSRPARERVRREARCAPAPAARRCARAVAPRLRGTASAVHRRRHRKRPDAGTRRCAADVRRPSAAGGHKRGSSRRRLPTAGRRTAGSISPSRSPRGACWGNLPSTRTKATWYAKPNRLWRPRRKAISRRSASRKLASRIARRACSALVTHHAIVRATETGRANAATLS